MKYPALVFGSILVLMGSSAANAQQPQADPAVQAVVGSVQLMINTLEQRTAALIETQKKLVEAERQLECWKTTTKACDDQTSKK